MSEQYDLHKSDTSNKTDFTFPVNSKTQLNSADVCAVLTDTQSPTLRSRDRGKREIGRYWDTLNVAAR